MLNYPSVICAWLSLPLNKHDFQSRPSNYNIYSLDSTRRIYTTNRGEKAKNKTLLMYSSGTPLTFLDFSAIAQIMMVMGNLIFAVTSALMRNDGGLRRTNTSTSWPS